MSKKQRENEKAGRETVLAREKEITEAQAKIVIERNTAERLKRCRQKIETACLEENCALGADIVWRKGQLIPHPVIIPKSEGAKK